MKKKIENIFSNLKDLENKSENDLLEKQKETISKLEQLKQQKEEELKQQKDNYIVTKQKSIEDMKKKMSSEVKEFGVNCKREIKGLEDLYSKNAETTKHEVINFMFQ